MTEKRSISPINNRRRKVVLKGALDRRSMGREGDRVGSGPKRLRSDYRASVAIYLFYLLIRAVPRRAGAQMFTYWPHYCPFVQVPG